VPQETGYFALGKTDRFVKEIGYDVALKMGLFPLFLRDMLGIFCYDCKPSVLFRLYLTYNLKL
jgi:hypothetical protein